MQFTSVISLAVVAFAVGISANPTPYGMDKTVVARQAALQRAQVGYIMPVSGVPQALAFNLEFPNSGAEDLGFPATSVILRDSDVQSSTNGQFTKALCFFSEGRLGSDPGNFPRCDLDSATVFAMSTPNGATLDITDKTCMFCTLN